VISFVSATFPRSKSPQKPSAKNMPRPSKTQASGLLGRILALMALQFLFAISNKATKAEELIEYPQPIELEFSQGYKIIDPEGRELKTIPGPALAKVQAYFSKNGFTYYISDWSYDRLKNRNIKPNLMAVKAVEKSRPIESLFPDEMAESNDPTVANGIDQFDDYDTNDRFVDHKTSALRERLSRTFDRELLYSDENWIVTSVFNYQGQMRGETDVSFYCSNDMQLSFRVRVSNSVINAAFSPEREQFLLMTSGRRGRTVNGIPQSLILVDWKENRKSIERTRLLSPSRDGEWATFEDISVKWVKNAIDLTFFSKDPYSGLQNDLIKNPTLGLQEFADLKVSTGFNESESNDSSRFIKPAGLEDLRLHKFPSFDQSYRRLDASIGSVSSGDHVGKHLIRATSGGGIFDLNLSTLQARYFKLHDEIIHDPGIFSDGTLRCQISKLSANGFFNWSDVAISLQSDEILRKLEPNRLLPGDAGQVAFTENSIIIGGTSTESRDEFQFLEIDTKGKTFMKFGIPAINGRGGGLWTILPNRRSVMTVYINGLYWREYSIDTGKQVDREVEVDDLASAKAVYPSERIFGLAPPMWSIASTCTDSSTSGSSYSTVLEDVLNKREIDIGGGERDLVGLPLVMDPDFDRSNGIASILSCGDSAGSITSVNLNSEDIHLTHQWSWSPADGEALYAEEERWVFIPIPSGYSVYRPFGSETPEKVFDIFFEGEQGYAIVLPSGLYAGSPGCEAFVDLIDQSGARVPASIIAPWRNRPAEVLRVLGGSEEDAAALERTTSRWLATLGIDPALPEPMASKLASVRATDRPALFQRERDLEIPLLIEAGEEAVTSVRILVNGVLADDLIKSGEALSPARQHFVKARLRLSEGQNWIDAVATDGKGRTGVADRFRVIHQTDRQSGRRFVVTMGVSKYERFYENLPGATRDTKAIGKLLMESKPGATEVLELVNDEVTRACYGRIRAFLSRADEDDEIVLFLAGHGNLDSKLEFNLIPGIGDDRPVDEIGIPLRDLIDIIEATRSRKRLILVDSCHSGVLGEAGKLKLQSGEIPVSGSIFRPMEDIFRLPGVIRGVTVIAGSRGFEASFEDQANNAGLFTTVVTEAFDLSKGDLDKDGGLTLSELRDYVTVRLPAISERLLKDHPDQKRQIPSTVAFEPDQDFVLLGRAPAE